MAASSGRHKYMVRFARRGWRRKRKREKRI
jgi:hypothetical protein